MYVCIDIFAFLLVMYLEDAAVPDILIVMGLSAH